MDRSFGAPKKEIPLTGDFRVPPRQLMGPDSIIGHIRIVQGFLQNLGQSVKVVTIQSVTVQTLRFMVNQIIYWHILLQGPNNTGHSPRWKEIYCQLTVINISFNTTSQSPSVKIHCPLRVRKYIKRGNLLSSFSAVIPNGAVKYRQSLAGEQLRHVRSVRPSDLYQFFVIAF